MTAAELNCRELEQRILIDRLLEDVTRERARVVSLTADVERLPDGDDAMLSFGWSREGFSVPSDLARVWLDRAVLDAKELRNAVVEELESI